MDCSPSHMITDGQLARKFSNFQYEFSREKMRTLKTTETTKKKGQVKKLRYSTRNHIILLLQTSWMGKRFLINHKQAKK